MPQETVFGIAEAEELERRFGDDGEDHAADEIDADDRDEVGEDLEGHDAPARLTQHLGGFDEIALCGSTASPSA